MKLHLCPICQEMKPPTHFACKGNAKGGSVSSPAKTKAARENAKLGGWPKGKKRPARAARENGKRGGRPKGKEKAR